MGGQGSITHEGAESTPREEFFPLQDLTGLGARGLDPEVPFHSMPLNPSALLIDFPVPLTVTVPNLQLGRLDWAGKSGLLEQVGRNLPNRKEKE